MAKRNTPSKQRIREWMLASGTAVSPDVLEAAFRGQMDRVTVYRVLASFCEDGFLHRVVADDGKAYYAVCAGCTEAAHRHDHAHFRCSACRRVECLPFPAAPQLPEGYRLESMNFWVTGVCRSCGAA